MGPELYASEVSPPHVRGLTATWGELFINIGILIGYISGWVLQPKWRMMVGLGALIPFLSFILQIFIPETPRWLMQQGRKEAAIAALEKTACYSEEQIGLQIEEINEMILAEQSGDQSALHELTCPKMAVVHAMLVGFGVSFFQQANGSEGVVYFTPTVLSLGGIKEGNAMYAITAAVGTCKAFFVAIALSTMDQVGRVKLLVFSSIGVSIALGLLAYAFTLSEPSVALAVLGLCGFMASFSVGWGPLSGVILAEVFPLRIRGSAVGIGWGINRFVSGTVALAFLPMNSSMGVDGTFFLFFGISLLALLFAYYVVPETKGLSLEAIAHIFEARAMNGIVLKQPHNAQTMQHQELPTSLRERHLAEKDVRNQVNKGRASVPGTPVNSVGNGGKHQPSYCRVRGVAGLSVSPGRASAGSLQPA
eukprot:CAMPEP_0118958496 /NCGR_PEP_ID=MMETSP1169-20130426/62652_1 /TAXON_ID=36882 /ORGANISM="Pyramimonas obovata, Strain CCMP722" /LENGTH=420 /DNA_ID=CAMNT_0006906613 /DNA_START=1356 /DNA_END=2619 /DNA_ORIENTATION=-